MTHLERAECATKHNFIQNGKILFRVIKSPALWSSTVAHM